jgi:stage II sporulation protein R
MKKWLIAFAVIILVAICAFGATKQTNTTYLRIHIRANSNLAIDQQVKHQVKDQVVAYLTPLLTEGKTFEAAKQIIEQNLPQIEQVANQVLFNAGFSYKAKAQLNQEFFPTRTYSSYTLDSGFYDALILSLGSGQGDNWWCVVYPPLCFTSADGVAVEYKSIIWDIISNWAQRA